MAKKQLSFAEKAAKKKGKGLKTVKFIKSILSEKTGHWRFKEKMVHLDGGESLDNALKRQEDALHALDMGMPNFDDEHDEKLATDSADTSENDQEPTDDTEETIVADKAVSEEKHIEEKSEESKVTKAESTSQDESETKEEATQEETSEESSEDTEEE